MSEVVVQEKGLSLIELADNMFEMLLQFDEESLSEVLDHNLRHASDDDLVKMVKLAMIRHVKKKADDEARILSDDVATAIENEILGPKETVRIGDRVFKNVHRRRFVQKMLDGEMSMDRQFIVNGQEIMASIDQVEEALKAAKASTKKKEYEDGTTCVVHISKAK